MHDHSHHHHHHHQSLSFENKTKWVVLISFTTMILEIVFGYITNSLALLADGWHMGSHTIALGLTWIAYRISRHWQTKQLKKYNSERLLSLAGYTNAIILLVVALFMINETIERFLNPHTIHFGTAIWIAVIGLMVNGVSALILNSGHGEKDNNLKAAYIHLLSDAITSISAILALIAGKYWGLVWLDGLSAIICSFIIGKWAIDLIATSGKSLLMNHEEHSH